MKDYYSMTKMLLKREPATWEVYALKKAIEAGEEIASIYGSFDEVRSQYLLASAEQKLATHTQLTSLDQCQGKTVELAVRSEDYGVMMLFTDGSYYRYNVEHDYDGCFEVTESFRLFDRELVKLGILTKEECQERRKKRAEDNRREREERDQKARLETYLQLKKEFENQPEDLD